MGLIEVLIGGCTHAELDPVPRRHFLEDISGESALFDSMASRDKFKCKFSGFRGPARGAVFGMYHEKPVF